MKVINEAIRGRVRKAGRYASTFLMLTAAILAAAIVASITIDRIYYTVSENTFNVASPELTVYVAPQGVMEPRSPDAAVIGTIAQIPAGETIDEADVELTPEGREQFRDYMKEYATPFNLIVATTVVIEAGDPIPTGRFVSVVRVDAHASPGL